METRFGALLSRLLSAAGIEAVYGQPVPGLPVVEVRDPAVAPVFAAAHRRVHGVGAAVHHDGWLLVDGAVLGAGALAVAVRTPDDLAGLLDRLVAAPPGGTVVHLDADLDAIVVDPGIVPEVRPRWIAADPDVLAVLEGATEPVVLAGPGIVHDGAVGGLHAFAAAGGVGVLNTWGAKGVYDWRSRHHWATIGLQELDFELGGLAVADLIVATGLDARESPESRWRLAPSITVPPGMLDALSEHWVRPRADIAMPVLRDRLGAVAQAGWASSGSPMPPSRVTLSYAEAFGSGGMVAADPGTAGYWVARTFTTTELGGAIVPAEADAHGVAAAAVVIARLARPGRRTLAVVDGPVSEIVMAVLEVGDALGAPVGVEVWDPSGPRLDVDAHRDRLRSLAAVERSIVAPLATDGRQMAQMIDAAGPVVAWASS